MSRRYFYGYGVAVYLATLQRLHGWSASAVSVPVTAYYIAGALLTATISGLYARFGPRAVMAGGGLAMAAGLLALGRIGQPWQLYPAFLVMSVGWGALSGAAINIILAPWWERRLGLAISLAFNGATLGGVIIAPALIWLIDAAGFTTALTAAAIVLIVVLLSLTGVMRREPADLGLGPDGDVPSPPPGRSRMSGAAPGRGAALRTWRFWSVSAPLPSP